MFSAATEPQFLCHQCLRDLETSCLFRARCDLAQQRLKVKSEALEEVFIKEESNSRHYNLIDSQLEQPIEPIGLEEKVLKESVKCSFCYKKFLNVKCYEKHLNSKHKDKQDEENRYEPYLCPYCGQSFPRLNGLAQHLKVLHKLSQETFCSNCKKPVFQACLGYHEVICLKQKEKVLCGICGKSLVRSSLKTHIKLVHREQNEVFECDLCTYKCKFKAKLTRHMRISHLKIDVRCKHCLLGLKNYSALVTHYRKDHPDIYPPFKCAECPFTTIEKCTLNTHKKIHAGEKAKIHRCNICGRAFHILGKLKIHIETHGEERKYACEICGAAFKTRPALYSHKSSHKASKDYECPLCDKAYTANQLLRLHVTKNHPEHELPPPGTIVKKTLINKWTNRDVALAP